MRALPRLIIHVAVGIIVWYSEHMAKMTSQQEFGGNWTQQKLELLQEYLSAYTKIFDRNEKARFFRTTYVDAFAGTGYMRIAEREPGLFDESLDDLETYQKGSVIRALEIQPALISTCSLKNRRLVTKN
jgi:hypothetical protein